MSESDTERVAEEVIGKIRDALDMDDEDTLVVQTPQFEREDGVEPGEPPLTYDAMNRLRRAEESTLQELGLRKWSDETGLWLLPHEWHPHIPSDYPLLSILDETTTREEMPAKPDKRLGVLSVGIVPDFEHSEGAEADR